MGLCLLFLIFSHVKLASSPTGGAEGNEAEEMVLAYAGGGGMGNRNARRAAKKKGKKGRGRGGMGFGVR